jgi:DNA-binding NarL/FixJ family response regulator
LRKSIHDWVNSADKRNVTAATTAAICTDDPVWGTGIRLALRDAFAGIQFDVFAAPQQQWPAWLQQRDRMEVLVLDWTPDTALELVRNLLQLLPETPVILWGRSIPVEFSYQAAQAGVRGVLRRPAGLEELEQCIRTVADHGTWFDNTLMSAFLGTRSIALTGREAQLVALLAHGLKNKEIAAALGVSEGTIKVYMSKLFQKLGVKDRFELALYGLKNLMPNRTSDDRQPARILLPGSNSVRHP